MDIKAMAKSKRSHTRQNQPRKHIPNPSKPSPSSTSGNPNSEKKDGIVRKKEEEFSLPSNWDRYQDDDDEQEGIELPIGSNSESRMKVVSDVVKPKSKGGNLGDLIAQARESRSSYSPSFHDTLPDLYQGLGPLLSVKGESILSWEGGDDFLVDDEATNIKEVPFLSLDLQDLAQQLAKVDLAKRLFIEEDLLPPELRGHGADEAENKTFFQKYERHEKTRVPETFDELLTLYWEEEENAKEEKDDGEKSSSLQEHSKDIKLHEEPSLVTHVTEKYSKPPPEFKGEDAEEELDMLLLNSFIETKPFVDIPVTSSLDDALDNLLEETSKEDNKGGLSESTNVKANSFHNPSSSSSSNPISEPKVLDDFDSWFDTI